MNGGSGRREASVPDNTFFTMGSYAWSRSGALAYGLLAGTLVDRLPRRRVLIAANVATAVLLASIPLAALAHELVLAQVFAVSFLAGSAGVFAGLAATACLPALVGRGSLVDANSKLATTTSTLSIVGPSLSGFLVQTLTAPIAITADAVFSALAAVAYAAIRRPEPPADVARRHLLKEVGDGIGVVTGHRILRVLVLVVASFNLFSGVAQAVLVIYMARELRLPPATIGLVDPVGARAAMRSPVRARRPWPRWPSPPTGGVSRADAARVTARPPSPGPLASATDRAPK